MSSASSGSSAGRWLLLVVMLGACGWAGFTLYERNKVGTAGAASATERPRDDRLEQLLTEANKQLGADALDAADDQFKKASGLAEKEPRVLEGLVEVAVRRAERLYWSMTLGAHDDDKKKAMLEQLDGLVHSARETIAAARRTLTEPGVIERLRDEEWRINVYLVVAFAQAGDIERARGALQARLADYPQRPLLEAYLGEEAAPAASGSASASASASVSASASASVSAPSYEPHDYELDHEPNLGDTPTTKGELQIPRKSPPPAEDLP